MATAMAVFSSVVGGATSAVADPIAVPSLVDDGVYPGAAEILATQNVKLIAGDGHVVLADCATPPVGDIGLLKVYTTDGLIGADGIGRVCFQVTAASGWLSLEVPGVYEIRGDGQRTGTGHEVTADLRSDAGEDLTVNLDPDGSTQVGLGADPNASPTMLLQLRAGSGLAPVTGSQAAVGKVLAYDRMCTATLVAPQWVLTATSCFAGNPLQPALTEGVPTRASSVVFPGHNVTKIDWVTPREGRDVALARLATPIQGITPVALATAVAPTGTDLLTVGYGRTGTEWITDQQRSAQVRLTPTGSTKLSAASGPLLCKGMAGGPVFDGGRLSAVLSQAGQAGCFDVSATDSGVTAARTDDLATWFNAITTTTADHTWSLADMPADASAGTQVVTAADSVFSGTGRPLTATAGAKWNTGDVFSPSVTLDGVSGSLATTEAAVSTDGLFSVSVWVKPTDKAGTVLSQDAGPTPAFFLSARTDKSWGFHYGSSLLSGTASSAPNTIKVGEWTHLTATYDKDHSTLKLYVDGVEVGQDVALRPVSSAGPFRVGAQIANGSVSGFFAGSVAGVQVWNRLVDPERAKGPAGFYTRLAAPTRFLDTRNGTGGTTGPVARGAVVRLKIAGVNGIPATGVTAVALSMATINPADDGYVTAWPDLTPQPNASSMTYRPGVVTSGYMIVPVGSNGYINISPGNRSQVVHIPPVDTSANILADVSGYFTTDSAAAGVSSYTPVAPVRFADSRSGTGGHTGKIPANTTWDYKVTGVTVDTSTIPDGVTAVAVNVTTIAATAGGYIATWEQGQSKPTASGLQYQATDAYANMAIVSVNPSTGKFSLSSSQSTSVIIDILGYFAPGTSGQKYHAFAFSGLVNAGSTIDAGGSTTVLPPSAMTGSNITLVVGVAVSSSDGAGTLVAYPSAASAPGTSTLNLLPNGTSVSNSAIVKTGEGGSITIAVTGSNTWLAVSCNGFFADA